MTLNTTSVGTTVNPNATIKFGGYNSNNKTRKQHDAFNHAWHDFAENEYKAGIEKIFYYMCDEKEGNLIYESKNDALLFWMYQGSAKLEGSFDGETFRAAVIITRLEKASPVIMRKLLDKNQGLLSSRIALDNDNNIVIMMNLSTAMFTPNIVYYGLRELLVLADSLDDSLVQDFGKAVSFSDPGLKLPVPDAEADVKYRYFKKWIAETLACLNATNRSDLHSIAAYLPLTLIQRIGYLCGAKGVVEEKLNTINKTYWENVQSQKLNLGGILQKLTKLIRELDETPEQTFKECLYRTRDSFSSKGPIQQKELEDILKHTIEEVKDTYNRSFPEHAFYTLEYAIGNLVADFNVPYILVELYHLQMLILHPDFFEELGMGQPVFKNGRDHADSDFIRNYISTVINKNRELFPNISFDYSYLDDEDAYRMCLGITVATTKMILTLS